MKTIDLTFFVQHFFFVKGAKQYAFKVVLLSVQHKLVQELEPPEISGFGSTETWIDLTTNFFFIWALRSSKKVYSFTVCLWCRLWLVYQSRKKVFSFIVWVGVWFHRHAASEVGDEKCKHKSVIFWSWSWGSDCTYQLITQNKCLYLYLDYLIPWDFFTCFLLIFDKKWPFWTIFELVHKNFYQFRFGIRFLEAIATLIYSYIWGRLCKIHCLPLGMLSLVTKDLKNDTKTCFCDYLPLYAIDWAKKTFSNFTYVYIIYWSTHQWIYHTSDSVLWIRIQLQKYTNYAIYDWVKWVLIIR